MLNSCKFYSSEEQIVVIALMQISLDGSDLDVTLCQHFCNIGTLLGLDLIAHAPLFFFFRQLKYIIMSMIFFHAGFSVHNHNI